MSAPWRHPPCEDSGCRPREGRDRSGGCSQPPRDGRAGAAEDHPSGDKRFKMLDATMKRHRFAHDALIEVLHTAQELFGYLQPDILYYIAHDLKLPPSRVYGVATFYHFFTFTPKGKHTCVVCTGTACYVKGADRLLAAIERRPGDGRRQDDARRSGLARHGPLPRRLRAGAGGRLRRRGVRRPGAGDWRSSTLKGWVSDGSR